MNVNELRINNFVMVRMWGPLSKSFTEQKINIDLLSTCNSNPSYVNPILINNEWLIRLGIYLHDLNVDKFIEDNSVGTYDNGKKYEYIIETNTNDYGSYIYTTKEIKYVHQLQNLYFALSDKELI